MPHANRAIDAMSCGGGGGGVTRVWRHTLSICRMTSDASRLIYQSISGDDAVVSVWMTACATSIGSSSIDTCATFGLGAGECESDASGTNAHIRDESGVDIAGGGIVGGQNKAG